MRLLPRLVARAVLLLAAVLVPVLLPDALPARPDLVLVIVAAAALIHGPATGALVGLFGGWLLDLVPPGSGPLGSTALAYLAAGALVGTTRRYAGWSPLVPFAVTGAAAVALLAVRAVTSAAGFGRADLHQLGWTLLVTMVAVVLLLPALVRLERWWVSRSWG
ncbi:MAG: rod shape-determining protein MreD [Ornithinimicrobium sp.]|jgi:rod shape-determining protein MreD|uniref:rod shape-determining protein MreD n=1 Tax=Ornithinimicrobium sp. TaxID=1977084 RepID=UPI001857DE7C|nr:rod shape-determining protein MreD [Actinomycetota bacterium]